jgi:hypothetical protein
MGTEVVKKSVPMQLLSCFVSDRPQYALPGSDWQQRPVGGQNGSAGMFTYTAISGVFRFDPT